MMRERGHINCVTVSPLSFSPLIKQSDKEGILLSTDLSYYANLDLPIEMHKLFYISMV